VFNQYGSREIPNIACECRHGHMHVFTDMVHLESTDDERLLVTSLTNRLMPMIRYENGDSGRLIDGDCDCGWPFPLMAMGMCRQNDLIRTSGGRTVHPSAFNRLLYGMTQIRQYQWQQVAPDRMRLSVVASPALSDEFANGLQTRLRAEVDAGMALEVRHVEEIPRSASGKHRFVIGL
jgi:phenylacetate-CoA ligase